MRRILIVYPQKGERGKIQEAVEGAGFQAVTAEDPETALKLLYQACPSLVVVANDSPEGREFCSRLHEAGRIPIVAVGESDELSRAAMLESGVDMYVIEPVRPRELLARIHALLRRYEKSRPGNPTLDPETRRVELRGNAVDLTPKEFHLFSFLALNRGKVIPSQRLIADVWSGKATLDTLHCYVRRLKMKLGFGSDGEDRLLSHRGEGYCLICAEEKQPKSSHGAQALLHESSASGRRRSASPVATAWARQTQVNNAATASGFLHQQGSRSVEAVQACLKSSNETEEPYTARRR
jgi:DNA-binding response OmpR family regulator